MTKYYFCIQRIYFYIYANKIITLVNKICGGVTISFLSLKQDKEIEIEVVCMDSPQVEDLYDYLSQNGIRLRRIPEKN